MVLPVLFEVKTFGAFSISRNTGSETLIISERDSFSRKLWGMLEYLVLFRKHGATRAELIDAFWGDDCSGTPDNNLKALIFRIRNVITELGFPKGKDIILYTNDCYRFSKEINFHVDAEEFDSLYNAAEKGYSAEDRLSNALKAIDLYDGDFLPKSIDFSWAASLNIYYRAKFQKLCRSAISLLSQAERYDEILRICQKALTIDPYEETLHRSMIEAFAATGLIQAALHHYTYVTNLFISQLEVSPSSEMTALYRRLTNDEKRLSNDIDSVRIKLEESEGYLSPFFCEYAAFRDIYRLKARVSYRYGETVQLVMLSLSSKDGQQLSAGQIKSGMGYLINAIESNLRVSDVFCQYSAISYLILLPSTDADNGQKAIERILKSFRTKHPRVSYSVSYTLLSVLPKRKLHNNGINEKSDVEALLV